MFIKVKGIANEDIIVNSSNIQFVMADTHYTADHKKHDCCIIKFCGDNTGIKTRTTFGEIEVLLDPASIEKRIDELKQENLRLSIEMQTDAAIAASMIGGK